MDLLSGLLKCIIHFLHLRSGLQNGSAGRAQHATSLGGLAEKLRPLRAHIPKSGKRDPNFAVCVIFVPSQLRNSFSVS